MRYVVYGAGAVGGVIGGHLSLAGRQVTLVARGAHLAAIREGGLRLDTGAGMRVIVAPATDSAAEIDWSPDTVVVLAVKSHQAAEALSDLRAHAPAQTPIICATNGIATEVAALRDFDRVYAVCVMLPATHLEPGVVVAKCSPTPGILDVGRIPDGTDDLTAEVAGDLRAAGFESEQRADILSWKRRKLLLNIGNGVDASFEPGADADELAARALAEGERVLGLSGVSLVSAADDRDRRGEILHRLRMTYDCADVGEGCRDSIGECLVGLDKTKLHHGARVLVHIAAILRGPSQRKARMKLRTFALFALGGDVSTHHAGEPLRNHEAKA